MLKCCSLLQCVALCCSAYLNIASLTSPTQLQCVAACISIRRTRQVIHTFTSIYMYKNDIHARTDTHPTEECRRAHATATMRRLESRISRCNYQSLARNKARLPRSSLSRSTQVTLSSCVCVRRFVCVYVCVCVNIFVYVYVYI